MEARGSAGGGRPVKGILKNRSGSGCGSGSGRGLADPEALSQASPLPPAGGRLQAQPSCESRGEEKKTQKWDEMNILATYHPPGKDYGLMKIDEPSTPYHSLKEEDAGSDAEDSPVPTADILAKKLAAAAQGQGPKILARQEDSSEEEEEEDDEVDLTPEELEKKRQFEMKRKMHYNEAQNIKLARQLIAKEMHGEAAEEEDCEEEEDDEDEMQDERKTSTESVPASSDPLENMAHSLEEVCSGL
ncbi:protein phosphatase inhibitor 2 isoform X1 [Crotalus tigris]|nr:protein phosphatase inhibitor 2 isoform X1 [Crotalus tigris]